MRFELLRSTFTFGFALNLRNRTFILGIGWDKKRPTTFTYREFKLTAGGTGSFGFGKGWVWYGTWRV